MVSEVSRQRVVGNRSKEVRKNNNGDGGTHRGGSRAQQWGWRNTLFSCYGQARPPRAARPAASKWQGLLGLRREAKMKPQLCKADHGP
eukprot:727921-Heterocapsa_arctica.AAC.1